MLGPSVRWALRAAAPKRGERPIDQTGTEQNGPNDNRLHGEPRPVIPPAIWNMRNDDAVERLLDIGRPYAQRIKRQRDAGPGAQRPRDERSRAGEFAKAGDEDHLTRERNPIRRDREQNVGHREMCDAGSHKECRQHPAHDRTRARKAIAGFIVHHCAWFHCRPIRWHRGSDQVGQGTCRLGIASPDKANHALRAPAKQSSCGIRAGLLRRYRSSR